MTNDIIHTYELGFFAAFLTVMYIFILPKVKQFIVSYDLKQKNEQNSLTAVKNDLLKEYQYEKSLTKDADDKKKEFEQVTADLKSNLNQFYDKINQEKVDLANSMTQKKIKELTITKKKEILVNALQEVKSEIKNMSKNRKISFARQVAELNKIYVNSRK